MEFSKIYALTDYKGYFGSKHYAVPYRSGMDKNLLKEYFKTQGIDIEYIPFSEVAKFPSDFWKNKPVIYTSSEDQGYYYKSFIEDIVLYLENCKALLMPSFHYLRANNNKVYMELLRMKLKSDEIKNIKSEVYGSLEEVRSSLNNFTYPVIVKGSEGSMGKNVALAGNASELVSEIRRLSKTTDLKFIIKEKARKRLHKGYFEESGYRKKIIIQQFIPGLKNDWKIYVMGRYIFIFYRPIFKKRIFRASGGGYENYKYGLSAHIPEGIFDFAQRIYLSLDVPFVSLDIGYDGTLKQFYLFEFQAVYFGTAGMLKIFSGEYFIFENEVWEARTNDKIIEEIYVSSIVNYLPKLS